MLFLHTSDIFWGSRPDPAYSWSEDRAADIRFSFKGLIELARQKRADFFLISGNLFGRQPLKIELNELNELFSLIPYTEIVIIPGFMDPLSPQSPVLHYNWNKNVHFVTKEGINTLVFKDKDVQITAIPEIKGKISSDYLQSLPESRHAANIFLYNNAERLPDEIFENLNFDYMALGGKSSPSRDIEKKYVYCGSPEPLSLKDTGPHGIVLFEFDPDSLKRETVFHQVSKVNYINLRFPVTPNLGKDELAELVRSTLEKRGRDNIYRIRITGKRSPNCEFSLDSLRISFRILDIIDETEPDYDFVKLFREHPSDIIGFYIRKMLKEPESSMTSAEKKALFYGIHALLSSGKED